MGSEMCIRDRPFRLHGVRIPSSAVEIEMRTFCIRARTEATQWADEDGLAVAGASAMTAIFGARWNARGK